MAGEVPAVKICTNGPRPVKWPPSSCSGNVLWPQKGTQQGYILYKCQVRTCKGLRVCQHEAKCHHFASAWHVEVPGSNSLWPEEFPHGVCMFVHVCAGTPVSAHSPNTWKGQYDGMVACSGCTLPLTPKGIGWFWRFNVFIHLLVWE